MVAVSSAYIAVRWIQRVLFIRRLRVARVTVEELRRRVEGGAPLILIDLRSAIDVGLEPHVIPGALWIAPDEVERRHAEIPRDRDVVLYCS